MSSKWGAFKWGAQKWGAASSPASYEQGHEADAKQDTAFLGKRNSGGALTDLDDDKSGYGADLTVGTDGIYENSTSRFNVSHPMAIEVITSADTSDTGTLFYLNHAANQTKWEIYDDGGTKKMRCMVAGSNVAASSVAIPDLTATAQKYVWGWSREANPLTTGASDAVRNRFFMRLKDGTGTLTLHEFDSAASSTTSSNTFFGEEDATGTNSWSGTIQVIRFSHYHHTPVEIREDFIEGGKTTPNTPTSETRIELPVPSKASGAGDHGQLVGPVYSWIAGAVRQQDLRQAQPVIAEYMVDNVPTITRADLFTNNKHRWFSAPGDDTAEPYKIRASWYWWEPVPRTCSHLEVWIHKQQWGSVLDMKYRLYSMDRMPGVDPGQVNYAYTGATSTASEGTGSVGGDWLSLGQVKIERDPVHGGTYLALALQFSGDSTRSLRVHFVSTAPVFVDPDGGEIPDLFNPGG